MSVNTESIIHNIMERISEIGYVKPEDIPNIDLYMDQVTTFMEAQLAHSKRYKDDKILTKTMINNYFTREEALFQRTSAGSDLYLLLQKHSVDQRHPDTARTADRQIF